MIRVPPLEEQRRIAEILDTIDETIQATGRVIAQADDASYWTRRRISSTGRQVPPTWSRVRRQR